MLTFLEFISKGIDVDKLVYKDNKFILKKSAAFEKIRDYFGMTFKELLGLIYLMKGKMDSKLISKIITLMLKKNQLLEYKHLIEGIFNMLTTTDAQKFKTSITIFLRLLKP